MEMIVLVEQREQRGIETRKAWYSRCVTEELHVASSRGIFLVVHQQCIEDASWASGGGWSGMWQFVEMRWAVFPLIEGAARGVCVARLSSRLRARCEKEQDE